MAVADLTQHNCQDFKTAQLTIKHNRQKAVLFFKDEAVQQAALGKTQGNNPLQIGPICGIHNGHINNDDELFAAFGCPRQTQVYGKIIFRLLKNYSPVQLKNQYLAEIQQELY